MTKVVNTKTAIELLIADMNAAQTRVAGDEHGAADMAVHIVNAVLDGEKGGNYAKIEGTVTRVSGTGKDKVTTQEVVTVDAARLADIAIGALTQEQMTDTLNALAGIAPKVQAARNAYAELNALPDADKKHLRAEIASAKTKAHSVTQTLRRPLRAAAFLIASDYDVSTAVAKTSKGSRVIMATRVIAAGTAKEKKVTESVSTKAIDAGLTALATKAGNVKKRAPQQPKGDTRNSEQVVEPNTIKVDDKTYSKDGKRNLADAIKLDTQGLTKMHDNNLTLNSAERRAVIENILAKVAMLDTDARADLMKGIKELAA